MISKQKALFSSGYSFFIVGYVDVKSVLNAAWEECSSSKGNLEYATKRCEETLNCNWIHDTECDNKNWRFCFNMDIRDYIKSDGKGCAKVKPGIIGYISDLLEARLIALNIIIISILPLLHFHFRS